MTDTTKNKERTKQAKEYLRREKMKEQLKEELKTENMIENYLSKDNPQFERLGAVIYNETMAYGVRLWIEQKQCFCNALITDDKRIIPDLPDEKGIPLSETKKIRYEYGIHYNTDFEDTDFVWENPQIKKYLLDEIKNIDKNKIYNELIDWQEKGIVWDEKEKHRPKKIACKIIASYFQPIWEHFERDSDVGHSTAGKSKKQSVPYYCGFNTLKIAKQSEADLYRSLDASCGWLFADNVDYMNEEEQSTTHKIIELGYQKRGGYARTRINNKKSGRFDVEKKSISGYMSFTSINQLDKGITATRNRIDLNYNLARDKESLTPEEIQKYNFQYDENKEFQKAAREIRHNLRVLALENWKDIRELYNSIKTPFVGRMDNTTRPVLTIAQWLGKNVYSDVLKYYQTQEEQMKMDISENDDEYEFYTELSSILWERGSGAKIPIKDLIDFWYELNYSAYEIGSETKKLKYKAQKELPKKLKEATCFKRVKLKHNASGWIIKLKDIEYLNLSRGYTNLSEIKQKLQYTIGKIDNLANLGNLHNLANLDNLNTDKITFSDLIPYFNAFERNENFVDSLDERLSRLARLPKLATLPKKQENDEKVVFE